MHNVQISTETFARLQAHAVPLVDTIETVINKALDALEGTRSSNLTRQKQDQFDPAAPPNLSFTTVRRVSIDHNQLSPNETYWNAALLHLVRVTAARGISPRKLGDLLIVNNTVGQRTKNGYKFVKEAGVSVQGQDANGAWRAIHHLAKSTSIAVDISFIWQNNPKASFPGQAANLSI